MYVSRSEDQPRPVRVYEMKVDSENMKPSSVVSLSPTLSFNDSFSFGEYCAHGISFGEMKM